MESYGRAGSILDLRQVRHSESLSTTIMLVRAMIVIVIALVVVRVMVNMRVLPRRKWISERAPCLLTASHFLIGKQATIELIS